MEDNDTIAAISTPPGQGAIGMVRLTGPLALEIGRALMRLEEEPEERMLVLGDIRGPEGAVIDRGFLACFRAPRSYTGEDMAELYCHGGPLVLKGVLEAALKLGARLAGPGEFTRRAFMNGKMDLSQAEAVSEMIGASTTLALASARERLGGSFSRRLFAIKEPLVDILARIEAGLDFPEEDTEGYAGADAGALIRGVKAEVERLAATFEQGRILKEGLKVLILGRPNAGKSSLLNVLLEEERAIVTATPGTTRDVVEEALSIRGIPVRLMDTAGLRDASDEAEAMGVRLARSRIAGADLIIYVVDLAAPFDDDLKTLKGLEGKRVIVALNKSDLVDGADPRAFGGYRTAVISALREEGIEALKDAIYNSVAAPSFEARPGEAVTSARHKECLIRCAAALGRADEAAGLPGEILAMEIRAALQALGEITGEVTTDDILDRIFSTFCIGK